jgi:hypothetical protein
MIEKFEKEMEEVAVNVPTVRLPMVVDDSVMVVPVAELKEKRGKVLPFVVLVAKKYWAPKTGASIPAEAVLVAVLVAAKEPNLKTSKG